MVALDNASTQIAGIFRMEKLRREHALRLSGRGDVVIVAPFGTVGRPMVGGRSCTSQ
jgi:hypothetical protein